VPVLWNAVQGFGQESPKGAETSRSKGEIILMVDVWWSATVIKKINIEQQERWLAR